MDQLEAVGQVFRLEQVRRGEQFDGGQTELGVFARAVRPFARAFAEQARADADEGFDAERARHADDLLQFFEFFDDHDDLLAQLDSHQRHADEVGVFIAVANDQAVRLGLQRQAGEQFRFAADLQSEVIGFAGVKNLFDDFAQLVDLDRKYAAVFALVIEFGDGAAESFIDGLNAMAKDVLEADEQRKLQPARFGLFDHVAELNGGAGFLQRRGHDVAGFINVKIFRAPTVDVVRLRAAWMSQGLEPFAESLI